LGTVTVFRDADDPPYAEVVLDNGDRIGLTVADGSLVIRRLSEAALGAPLFEADAELVTSICAALSGRGWARRTTPLQILAGTVAQIGSASEVRAAFQAAAHSV
jgi:hypothetical protein